MPNRLSPAASRRTRLALAVLSILAIPSPRAARAAWPPDPLINVPLCTTAFTSNVTSVVSDGKGGAIVVWYEDRNGDFDVFARRVRADGTPLWAANGVAVAAFPPATEQVISKAVSDGAGGVIVGWLDGRGGPKALYFERLDSTGTRLWAASGVIAATSASTGLGQYNLIADGAGGVVAVWSIGSLQGDIYAQRLNASGVVQWGANAKAICLDPNDQVSPVVQRSGAGNFVFAWEDGRAAFRTQIFGQSVNPAGTTQWTLNGRLLAGSADNALNPMLVPMGASNCLMFRDADSAGVGDIRGQLLDPTGVPLWPAAGLHMFPEGVSGLLGAATDQLGGAFLVAQQQDPQSGLSPLVAQRVVNGGSLLHGLAGWRVSSILSNQIQVAMIPDNAGGAILTWFDDARGLPGVFDICAQRMAGDGSELWSAAGIPVCRQPNTGPGLALTADGSGGAVMAWSDTRNSPSADVYAQGVDAAGQLGVGLAVDPPAAPAATALARPAPNPLPHGRADITYTLKAGEHVRVQVVDPVGRIVSVLEEGDRGAGTYHVAWDGTANGERLRPGLYLVQLLTPTHNEIRRIVLL